MAMFQIVRRQSGNEGGEDKETGKEKEILQTSTTAEAPAENGKTGETSEKQGDTDTGPPPEKTRAPETAEAAETAKPAEESGPGKGPEVHESTENPPIKAKPASEEITEEEKAREGKAKEEKTEEGEDAGGPEADSEDIPEPEWVRVNVTGFDDMMPKGIPKGSAVLMSGGPGTGKTTFCLQVLYEAAKRGQKCIYLTFEESILRLKQHMKSYGWNPQDLEKEGNLLIKKMEPFDISRSIEALLARASGELTIELEEVDGVIPKGFNPDIIVLDSLSAVAAAFGGREEGYRIYIDQLFSVFKDSGATSFLISEIEQDANKYSKSGIEEFLADAVVVFYNIRNKNVRINALEILKIRGTPHQKKIVPFKIISGKGITVYPQEVAIT